MSRWWRAYDEAVDDPKLIALTDEQHRFWFNLLCVCSAFGGSLPDVRTVSIKLRMQPRRVIRLLSDLRSAELLDSANGLISPHNWEIRQYKSDVSTGRVQRYRKRKRNVSGNVSETPPETDTETDKEDTATRYVFESGIIKLSEKTFNEWTTAFPRLDLRAELTGLSEWASKQPKWFFAVSGALAKRNREARTAVDKAGKQPFKYNGGEGII